MNAAFKEHIDALPELLNRLLAAEPVRVGECPSSLAASGVYVLSEKGTHLYVGRSDRLRARMRDHGNPSSAQTKSAFAFRLAREATGQVRASYKPKGSRKELMQDPMFSAEFVKAKARIAQMDMRCIEVSDPIRQALLEMYAALELQTPYNSFGNH